MNLIHYFHKRLLTFFIVVLLLFTLVACTPAPVSSPDPTSTPTSLTNTNTATDFVDGVARAMPSVVKIEVTYGPQGAPGDPSASGGAGTGWVIRQDGLIVTNNHVVDGAQIVTVILPDGTKQAMTNVKTNPGQDLAVLQVKASNLQSITIGDSSTLKLGQPVAAIGNALNLGIRVTTGVISQLDVTANYSNVSLTGLIETDASVNPGNSGGVLINILGDVVGITNAGLMDQNLDVESFGYAIGINEAMPVIDSLISEIP